jgi:hypothetical protein
VERVAPEEAVRHATLQPPDDTRAWGRVALQRRAGAALHEVDWDFVRVRLADGARGEATWRVDLTNPAELTLASHGDLVRQAGSLAELVYALGGVREGPTAGRTSSPPTAWAGSGHGIT